MANKTPTKSTDVGKKDAAKQVLFIQGGGEGTHEEWDDKLVASLERALGPGYDLRYPRMPNEEDPNFGAWSAALEREIAQLDDGAILVGHSIGGTILIHAVTNQPQLLRHIAAICLITAPFAGDGGWPSDDIVPGRDWAAPLAGITVYLYQGDADETTPMTHLDLYAKAIPHAYVRRLNGRNHQLNDDLSEVAQDISRVSTPA
jgi:predicted alpha/beta hydrolase family esterase